MTTFRISRKCSSPNTRNKILSCKVWVDFVSLSSQVATSSILALRGAVVMFLFPVHHILFLSMVITMAFGGEDRQHWTLLGNMSQKYKRHISNCEQWKLFRDPWRSDWQNPLALGSHKHSDSLSLLLTLYKILPSDAPLHRKSYVDWTHAFISQQ